MKYFYVDNFRGFSEALIPMRDVSLMVGENSTGKTSLLSLVRIVASPRFWYNLDFDADDVRLGHFKDLVSVHSADQSYFRIGFADTTPLGRQENGAPGIAFLMTFVETEGMPDLSKLSYLNYDQTVTVRVSKRGLSYKVAKSPEYQSADEFARNLLRLWGNEHKSEIQGTRAFVSRKELGSPIGLLDVIYRLQTKLRRGTSRRTALTIPEFGTEFVWLAPIRSKPHRTYDEYKIEFSAEGDHTPYLIKKLLGSKLEAVKFKAFIERVGKSTGLFESVSVRRYGRSKTSPFELDVVVNRKALSVSNVGYGVSQSLPVFVELFARTPGSWFAIQQPEVHLHPRAQAAIGDILYELATIESKGFLVETHSDYLIDRFRFNLKKGSRKPSAQILYFERCETGNRVYELEIGENGELPPDQPKGYRNFFVKEQLRVLGLDDVHRN
jgi:hypothetical protein